MKPSHQSLVVNDPVERLNDVLDKTWLQLCCMYDASAPLPNLATLFAGVHFTDSFQIAQTVLLNMLLEVMENIGRFSPWYTRPARAFGLLKMRPISAVQSTSLSVQKSKQNTSGEWILAPEAVIQWQPALVELTENIEASYPLVHTMILVEGLMDRVSPGDEWVSACCSCDPPREIQVTQNILNKGEICCDACLHTFRISADPRC